MPPSVTELGDEALFTYFSDITTRASVATAGDDVCDRAGTKPAVERGCCAALYASQNDCAVQSGGGDTSRPFDGPVLPGRPELP